MGQSDTTRDREALAILEDAHRRCGEEDMRTGDVFVALMRLENLADALHAELWPFEQFRQALGEPGTPFTVDAAGRGQVVHAALNGIRRVCQLET